MGGSKIEEAKSFCRTLYGEGNAHREVSNMLAYAQFVQMIRRSAKKYLEEKG